MLEALRGLFGSKKAIAAIVSTIAAIVAVIGWNVSDATLGLCLSPVVAYILGQGMADMNKEAAKEQGLRVVPINGGEEK